MTDNKTTEINKENENLDKFAQLQLHQSLQLDDETSVMRVVGGWIYKTEIECHNQDEPLGYAVSTCFVPCTSQTATNIAVGQAKESL